MDSFCNYSHIKLYAIMNQNSIFISGKITGISVETYTKNFCDIETQLLSEKNYSYGKIESRYKKVINPVKLCSNLHTWFSFYWIYMIIDIYYLVFKCDSIFMLNNWKYSKGAIIEFKVAKFFNKTIIYQI